MAPTLASALAMYCLAMSLSLRLAAREEQEDRELEEVMGHWELISRY